MENISPKEWAISVIVVLLTFALAIFINPFVKDSMLDDIRNYQNALQVDGDSNQFNYAYQTHVGNVFAYGKMNSDTPVSLPELVGQYSIIEKTTERYTQHQRYVCDSHDKDGNCTSGHYETYYTWDFYGRNTYISNTFQFLSVTFQNAQLGLEPQTTLDLSASTISSDYVNKIHGDYLYQDDGWWTHEGDIRYYYKTMPVEFNVSMFTKFDGISSKANVYYEKTRSEVLKMKESNIRSFDVVYYLLWVIVVGGCYFWWAYSYGDVE